MPASPPPEDLCIKLYIAYQAFLGNPSPPAWASLTQDERDVLTRAAAGYLAPIPT